MTISTACFATANFSASDGIFVIPDVSVDGVKNYTSVTLKLDIATGTFEIVDATPKNTNISDTPKDSIEQSGLKVDLLGCEQSGVKQISCHVEIVNNRPDKQVSIWGIGYINTAAGTLLYDNLGNAYSPTGVNVLGKTEVMPIPTLIQDIPIRAVYIFDIIDIHATSISVFKPYYGVFEGSTNMSFQANFRNIDF